MDYAALVVVTLLAADRAMWLFKGVTTYAKTAVVVTWIGGSALWYRGMNDEPPADLMFCNIIVGMYVYAALCFTACCRCYGDSRVYLSPESMNPPNWVPLCEKKEPILKVVVDPAPSVTLTATCVKE
jgi:hypothetical protein